MLLQSAPNPRYGVYCPFPGRVDPSIPEHLLRDGICSNREPYSLWRYQDPSESIETLMNDCATTPRELPPVDRLNYALSEAQRSPLCEEQADSACAFFHPLNQKIVPHLLSLAEENFIKGFGYGVITVAIAFPLTAFLKCDATVAKTTAEIIALALQLILDNYYLATLDDLYIDFYLIMLIIFIKALAALSASIRAVDALMTASIMFFNFLPVLRGLNVEKFLLTAVAMSSLVAGKHMGTAMTTFIGGRCHSVFFKKNMPVAEEAPEPAEEIFQRKQQ